MALSVYTHTDAIVARLQAQGLTVGNHSGEGLAPPYTVVYLIAGGEVDGPVDAPDTDGRPIWQLTSVGAGAEQALWQADRARAAILGWNPTVAGRSVEPFRLVLATDGATRDDDVNPPVFYAIDRVTAWSYPT